MAAEGGLEINGKGPIVLFDNTAMSANDNKTASVKFTTPADWWSDGTNTLRFVHTLTRGYRIESASLKFETTSIVKNAKNGSGSEVNAVDGLFDDETNEDFHLKPEPAVQPDSLHSEAQNDTHGQVRNAMMQAGADNVSADSPISVADRLVTFSKFEYQGAFRLPAGHVWGFQLELFRGAD